MLPTVLSLSFTMLYDFLIQQHDKVINRSSTLYCTTCIQFCMIKNEITCNITSPITALLGIEMGRLAKWYPLQQPQAFELTITDLTSFTVASLQSGLSHQYVLNTYNWLHLGLRIKYQQVS